jgi:hypothetical protein
VPRCGLFRFPGFPDKIDSGHIIVGVSLQTAYLNPEYWSILRNGLLLEVCEFVRGLVMFGPQRCREQPPKIAYFGQNYLGIEIYTPFDMCVSMLAG